MHICALKQDMEIFEHSETEIGKHGLNFSREQKQCIQVAHAIYQDCEASPVG